MQIIKIPNKNLQMSRFYWPVVLNVLYCVALYYNNMYGCALCPVHRSNIPISAIAPQPRQLSRLQVAHVKHMQIAILASLLFSEKRS